MKAYHYITLQDPNVALSLPPQKFARPPYWCCWKCEIKKYNGPVSEWFS